MGTEFVSIGSGGMVIVHRVDTETMTDSYRSFVHNVVKSYLRGERDGEFYLRELKEEQ